MSLAINILTKELDEYKKALRKSNEAFLTPVRGDRGELVFRLSPGRRLQHVTNLPPIIEELERDIQTLKTNNGL